MASATPDLRLPDCLLTGVHLSVNNLPKDAPESATAGSLWGSCLSQVQRPNHSVSHGSAYTVVRATQQVNEKWQEFRNPWTDWLKNMTYVITTVTWPSMLNFIKLCRAGLAGNMVINVNKKLSWCWQTRATRFKVIRYVTYGFLLVYYSNFVPKTFEIKPSL